MTKEQLFESLQYLDDALLEEAPAVNTRRVWLRWGAAAACALLVAGAVLALPQLKSAPATGVGEVYWTPLPQGAASTPQPVGVPGPGADVPSPGSDVLAWNEVDGDAAGRLEADVGGVMQVAEPLTAAQRAECAPEIREAWMEDFEGDAVYYLRDGAGGLAYIEMTISNAAWGGKSTIRLRDAAAPEAVDCIIRPQPETDKVGSINGQEYRAYRVSYDGGAGGAAAPWTEMIITFEKENAVYTLVTDAPEAQADRAETDLLDLLLCYIGTHSVPDLSAFQYGEYLYRDDTLTLAEALADPDFGAYLPAEGPEGFSFDFARRYQFEEVTNYLMAFWTQGSADLQWLVQPVTAEARSRVVAPEERERYDRTLYPAPWSDYVAPENRTTVENPVFRIEELTPELISARVHTGDEGMTMFRFGVLYESGVLVEVNAKGVSAEWVYQALTQFE